MKKRYILYAILGILIFLGIVFFPKDKNSINKINEYFEDITSFIKNNDDIPKSNIEKNDNFYSFIDTLENVNYLSSFKFNSKVKFLTKENKELLTASYVANLNKKNDKYNTDGTGNIKIEEMNIDIKMSTYVKGLNSDNYEIFLTVPSVYKKSLGMNETENYLKITKDSSDKLKETFLVVKAANIITSSNIESEKESTLTDKFESVLNYTQNGKTINTGIYDITFNRGDLLTLYKQINSNPKYKNSLLCSQVIMKLLKDEENIKNVYKLTGQVATSQGVATDLYLELTYKTGAMTVVRITLDNINSAVVERKEFHSNEISQFSTFMESLIETNPKKQDDKTISIGNIYFTSKDEKKKVDEFTEDMLKDPINVFINYSKCSIKTNLVIRWYYENQSIQIIENKLNNGEYEEGILKSSITFSDIATIPKGTYRVEVYIDGQDRCYGQETFVIK